MTAPSDLQPMALPIADRMLLQCNLLGRLGEHEEAVKTVLFEAYLTGLRSTCTALLASATSLRRQASALSLLDRPPRGRA
jgi:hypothetical protein